MCIVVIVMEHLSDMMNVNFLNYGILVKSNYKFKKLQFE